MTTTTDTTTPAKADAAGAGWFAYGALTVLLDGIDDKPRDMLANVIRRVVKGMETNYGVVSR